MHLFNLLPTREGVFITYCSCGWISKKDGPAYSFIQLRNDWNRHVKDAENE